MSQTNEKVNRVQTTLLPRPGLEVYANGHHSITISEVDDEGEPVDDGMSLSFPICMAEDIIAAIRQAVAEGNK